jgi:hypothetical protein
MARPKHPSEFTKRDWQKFIPYLAFFGVFMSGLGVYSKDPKVIWFGVVFVAIALVSGFILHFFFGVKIIDMRRDFKHKKFR